MLNVPVGAMVVRVAFLKRGPFGLLYTLFSKLGKVPLFFASSQEASSAAFKIKPITSLAVFTAFSELYGIFSFMSISAKPMIPKPIFLFPFVISSIFLRGYLFISITLSKK